MRKFTLIIIGVFFIAFWSWGKDSLFHQGVTELSQENFEAALKDFIKLTKQQPSFSSYYNLGVSAGNIEDWNQAKWAFESALKYKPTNGDAQYNARFVTNKMSGVDIWEHPYSWIDRFVVTIGDLTWSALLLISSVGLGVFAFLFLSKRSIKEEFKKWSYRLVILTGVLFLVSTFGVFRYNNHFKSTSFVILKSDSVPFFASPNGMQVEGNVSSGARLHFVGTNESGDWVKIKTLQGTHFWVQKDEVYQY